MYAIIPIPAATITEGIIASPSSPSVKFTAFAVATRTKALNKMNQIPSCRAKSLKKGRNKVVSSALVAK